jgi:hypothetical protein
MKERTAELMKKRKREEKKRGVTVTAVSAMV